MSKMLDVTNPYTGELVESIKLDTVEELKEKVAKAKAAQPAWERTPIVQRAKLIMAMIDKIEEKNEEIGTICANRSIPQRANALMEEKSAEAMLKERNIFMAMFSQELQEEGNTISDSAEEKR